MALPRPTQGAGGADGYTIGEVLNQLKEEFEDITISKIRFLESEGLIYPDRTESGYRKFTDDDVDRLRFILTAQRDHYLPLKVIREQLERLDAGELQTRPAPKRPETPPPTATRSRSASSSWSHSSPSPQPRTPPTGRKGTRGGRRLHDR